MMMTLGLKMLGTVKPTIIFIIALLLQLDNVNRDQQYISYKINQRLTSLVQKIQIKHDTEEYIDVHMYIMKNQQAGEICAITKESDTDIMKTTNNLPIYNLKDMCAENILTNHEEKLKNLENKVNDEEILENFSQNKCVHLLLISLIICTLFRSQILIILVQVKYLTASNLNYGTEEENTTHQNYTCNCQCDIDYIYVLICIFIPLIYILLNKLSKSKSNNHLYVDVSTSRGCVVMKVMEMQSSHGVECKISGNIKLELSRFNMFNLSVSLGLSHIVIRDGEHAEDSVSAPVSIQLNLWQYCKMYQMLRNKPTNLQLHWFYTHQDRSYYIDVCKDGCSCPFCYETDFDV